MIGQCTAADHLSVAETHEELAQRQRAAGHFDRALAFERLAKKRRRAARVRAAVEIAARVLNDPPTGLHSGSNGTPTLH